MEELWQAQTESLLAEEGLIADHGSQDHLRGTASVCNALVPRSTDHGRQDPERGATRGGGALVPRSDALIWRDPCPNSTFGCHTYATRIEMVDHRRVCPFSPCGCPERGCRFSGSPLILCFHVLAKHSHTILKYRYGHDLCLDMVPAQPWQVLRSQDDGSVFLVSLGRLGASTTVSLLCVRANDGAAAPQYTCTITQQLSDGSYTVMMSKVRNSMLLGGLHAPEHGMFTGAHQDLLLSGERVSLRIRIEGPFTMRPTVEARQARS